MTRIAAPEPESEAFEKDKETALTVYPNPVNQYLKVQGAEGAFSVCLNMGVEVNKFDGSQADLTELQPGIYYIRHQQSGKTKVFVKENPLSI